jgi:hypothetical protein
VDGWADFRPDLQVPYLAALFDSSAERGDRPREEKAGAGDDNGDSRAGGDPGWANIRSERVGDQFRHVISN